MSVETINSLLAVNKLMPTNSVARTNLLLQPPVGNPAFTNLSAPTVLSVTENYDLGPVLLAMANNNILSTYAAGGDQTADMVIAQQQTVNGSSWTPFSGSVQGGGTNTASGTVTTSGTAVTWVSGTKFHATWHGNAVATTIIINSVQYTIASITDNQHLTLTSSAGTQGTAVAYVAAPVSALFYTALPTSESANIMGVVTATGKVILAWENDPDNSSSQTWMTRSTDNGATWSAPANVFAGYPSSCPGVVVPPNASSLFPSGCLFLTAQVQPSAAVLYVSTDDGVTWTSRATITGLTQNEIALAWVGGNTLIGFSRNVSGTSGVPLFFLSSTDMGNTWTVVNSNIDLTQTTPPGASGLQSYNMISPCIINKYPGYGQVTVLFAERSVWTGISPAVYTSLRAVTFSPQAALANPLSFPVGQVLDTAIAFSQVDAGYPSAALIATTNNALIQWNKNPTGSGFSTHSGLYAFTATYNPSSVTTPTIANVSPQFGTPSGGTAVTIYGTNFRTGATVNFGSNPATSVVVVSQYEITCNSPAGSGAVSITVTNTDATQVTAALAFGYSAFNPVLVASGVSAAGTGPVTLNTTGATLLIAVISGGTSAGMGDSVGGNTNAWNLLTTTLQNSGSGNNNTRIAYAYAKTGGGALQTGASHVFTPTGTVPSCTVYAFSGTPTDATVFDSNNQTSNLAGTVSQIYSLQPGTVTPNIGDIVIVGWGNNGSGTATNDTPPSGFIGELKQYSGATLETIGSCYQLNLPGIAINPTWSVQTNNFAGCVIACFK